MGNDRDHLYTTHPMSSIGEEGGHTHSINRDHWSRLYRLNEFDMGTFSQMAAQLQSIVSDPSIVGPMLTAAATGMATNYAGSKLGKINPMGKIEQAVTQKLDNTKIGKWVNNKIGQASDYMDSKLGITNEISPKLKSAIGAEVTTQLNARGIGRGSGGSTGSAGPTPPPSPNSSNSRPPTPPRPSGTAGGASGSR